MAGRSVFVAATRQNVGKTSLSLGLVSALKGRGVNVGFMKPVGQQHVSVQGIDEQTGQPVTLQVDISLKNKPCSSFQISEKPEGRLSIVYPIVMIAESDNSCKSCQRPEQSIGNKISVGYSAF